MIYWVKLFIILIGVSVCKCDNVTIRVYKESFEDFVVVPLDEPTGILTHLDLTRSTLFYCFGINGSPTVESVQTVLTAFIGSGKYNVVLLDWSVLAENVFKIVPISYIAYNVPGAEEVGCRFGKALVSLFANGLDMTNIILMGHSMGAQVMGSAGRCAETLLEKKLPIIVGLDPAGPAFTTVITLAPYLDKTCADYVVILHTDPKGLGTPKATGHLDIYPNYNQTYTLQSGCTEKASFLSLNSNTACSHDRAWRLMAASVAYPTLLEAIYATSGEAWLAGQGDSSNTTYISISPPEGSFGTYYLRTGAEYPYGLGEDGKNPQ